MLNYLSAPSGQKIPETRLDSRQLRDEAGARGWRAEEECRMRVSEPIWLQNSGGAGGGPVACDLPQEYLWDNVIDTLPL